MHLALNFLYLALLCLFAPLLLFRAFRSGKYREGWSEKVLGKAPWRIGDRPCVWFHAVSVGEVLLLRPMVGELVASAAGLGRRDLDHDADRPGGRPPDVSRTW